MRLNKYIEAIGDAAAAELFGVKERTAASWRRGERRPRPEQAAVIVEASRGKVSYAEIYAPDAEAA
jgi:DNA-binding transcriptional regulator YdaS (Cro superfamily)